MKVRHFHVRPNIPHELLPLKDLAMNLWFSWNWEAVQLFIRLNPVLWEKSYQALKEEVEPRLRERLRKIGKEDLFDKIATEEQAETPDKLVEFLTSVEHPALSLAPLM